MQDRTTDELLAATRSGDATAWGVLLERYRPYLALLIEVQLGRRLQVKADPADLVQEAFLQAHRKFAAFRGTTGDEFLGWLREILASRLAKLVRRYYGTAGRDVRLERNLAESLTDSSRALDWVLADSGGSPSDGACGRERAVRVVAAVERLPPDYRRVLILRHLDGLTFPEVGERMGRSADAVTQLWARAIRRLRDALGDDP
jgi:RNA polymerase sigma-70 factor (ECF subfamily)